MMSRKPATGKQDAEDSLAILHPERTVSIGGETITVREYGFVEGMRLAAHIQPIVDALADAIGLAKEITLGAIRTALGGHPDDVVALIAAASDRTPEWVRGLSDADGDTLLLTWYGVNSSFFIRRVVAALHVKRAMASALIGQTSTPPSSHTDTMRNGSGPTRSVN